MNGSLTANELVPAKPSDLVLKELNDLEPGKTKTSIIAKLKINEKIVDINTGDIQKGEFAFYLTEKVEIGTAQDFLRWFNQQFNTSIPDLASNEEQAKLPDIKMLKDMIKTVMTSPIILDGLIIDQKEQHYYFGMSVDFSKSDLGSIKLIGDMLQLEGLGFQIMKKDEP